MKCSEQTIFPVTLNCGRVVFHLSAAAQSLAHFHIVFPSLLACTIRVWHCLIYNGQHYRFLLEIYGFHAQPFWQQPGSKYGDLANLSRRILLTTNVVCPCSVDNPSRHVIHRQVFFTQFKLIYLIIWGEYDFFFLFLVRMERERAQLNCTVVATEPYTIKTYKGYSKHVNCQDLFWGMCCHLVTNPGAISFLPKHVLP